MLSQEKCVVPQAVAKEQYLHALGFKVVSIWECSFRELQHSPEYKGFVAAYPQLLRHLPLNVCEAFFGGCTNAARLYFKFLAGEKGVQFLMRRGSMWRV